jgi:hypothetical protein
MKTPLLLLSLFLAVNLCATAFFSTTPFRYDEGIYSLMILEFSGDPAKIMPTLAGVHAEWKPPLFTWVYSVFYLLLRGLPFPPELVMRVPSAVFSSLASLVLYFLGRKLYDDKTALYSALLYAGTPIALFSSVFVQMEALSILLVLLSVYSYVDKKTAYGTLFLGLLSVTKWLYAGAVIVFVSLYFISRRERPAHVFISFLAVPAFISANLVLAYFYGSFDDALLNLALDAGRTAPSISPLSFIVMLQSTFPVSLIFLAFLAIHRREIPRELPQAALAMIAFFIPLAQQYVFWYSIISLPFMSLFLAKRLGGIKEPVIEYVLISGFAVCGFVFLMTLPELSSSDLVDTALFMKNKEVVFAEPNSFYINWAGANNRFIGTDQRYILLEQNNPGLLYYRFNDTRDYSSLRPVFTQLNESIPCLDYLVVHTYPYPRIPAAPQVPSCYDLMVKGAGYDIYSRKATS